MLCAPPSISVELAICAGLAIMGQLTRCGVLSINSLLRNPLKALLPQHVEFSQVFERHSHLKAFQRCPWPVDNRDPGPLTTENTEKFESFHVVV